MEFAISATLILILALTVRSIRSQIMHQKTLTSNIASDYKVGKRFKSESQMIGVVGVLQHEIHKLWGEHINLKKLFDEQLNDALKTVKDRSSKKALRKVYFDEWEKVNWQHSESISRLEKRLTEELEIEKRQKDIKDRSARERQFQREEDHKKREEVRRAQQVREAEKLKRVKDDAIIENYRQEFHSWSVSSLKDTFVEVVLSPLLNAGQTIPANDKDGLYAFALRGALHGRGVRSSEINALIINRKNEILERRQLVDKLYKQVKAVQNEQISRDEAVIRAHNEAVDRYRRDIERYNSYVREHNASLGNQAWGFGLGIGFWF